VGAVKAVEAAGIPKKALSKGVSSLRGQVKGRVAGGRAVSTRYKHKSQAQGVWCAYVEHVGEGPLSQTGNPCLLVSLQDVSGMPTFGDLVMTRLDGLSAWRPHTFGHSVVNGRANETAFVGSKSAYQVRELLAEHVGKMTGRTRPTRPDVINKMATVVQSVNKRWVRPATGSFAGNKNQQKTAADKYVRDAYNDLARQEHIKFVAELTLDTRVDMVVLCLLAWYDMLTTKEKKRIGHTGSEVH
jgi:hypothetical protein